MNDAIVQTSTGGIFRLGNAFLLGMDHIVHGGTSSVYEIRDGDQITFVAA